MVRKIKLFTLIAIICILTINSSIYANTKNSNRVISGDYQFSSSLEEVQLQNKFEYKDDCFTRSSYLGCKHLESLSIQVAASSISFYSDDADYYEIETEDNAHNVIDFLTKMEFDDVETNNYYKTEKRENSVGVCVGHKNIIQSGDSYTLLAIVPRSAGYKQEWAGNFTIGDGDIHEGFKSARDEILRFVKQYITKNEIEGKIKVWISGYSRGAAISDMLGGFFAGGGIDYFDGVVSITPEDVYCYTIGTPRTIKDGLDKNIELSVSANRDDIEYSDDTEGEEFIYTKGGNVNVGDEIYGGLRNLISSSDSFPLLPPEKWGFTHYGNRIDPTEGLSSIDDALRELKSISKYVYAIYTEDDKPKQLKMKTFDLKNLEIVDKGEKVNPTVFMKEKIDGLASRIESNKDFHDEHYQDGLKSFVGAYGLLAPVLSSAIDDASISTSDAIKTLLSTYVAYASELLQEEDIAESDNDAVAIIIKDLLEHFFEIDVDLETFTIDDLFTTVMEYLAENIDEPVGEKAVSAIVNSIPEEQQGLIAGMFGQFHKDYYSDKENYTVNTELNDEDYLKEFIKACAYGADPECPLGADYEEPQKVRSALYMLIALATSSDYPEIPTLLVDEATSEPNAQALLTDAVDVMMSYLLVSKDEEGAVIKSYDDISELADELLIEFLTPIIDSAVDICNDIYGNEYSKAVEDEFDCFKDNISETRKAISTLMFYTEGEYNTISSLEGVISLVSDAMTVVMSHFDEIYLAYSRNSDRYEDHFLDTSEEIYHEVLFDLGKGKFYSEVQNPSKVLDGECLAKPENPSRNGFRFDGWYIDEEFTTSFNFESPINEDLMLYAKWHKKTTPISSSSHSSTKSKKEENTSVSSQEPEMSSQENLALSQEQEVSSQENLALSQEPEVVSQEIVVIPQEKLEVQWSNASEWAVEELTKANKKRLIPSTLANKNFAMPITRSEFASVAVELYEAISGKLAQVALVNPFIDTNDEFVLKAYNLGITFGISDNEFGDGEITREQMATMLTRAISVAGIDVSIDIDKVEKFADDNEIHSWGREAIYYMSNLGIIKGMGNNNFGVNGDASREQSLLISVRSVEMLGRDE